MKTFNIKFFLYFVMFLTAFSCKEQELNTYSNENDVNAVTRSLEAAYAPKIESVSLTETDKAILDKQLKNYTVFNLNTKELAEYLYNNEGSGIVRLKINEDLDWAMDLESSFINPDKDMVDDTLPFVIYEGITHDSKKVSFAIDEDYFSVRIVDYRMICTNYFTQNRDDKSFIVYHSWDVIPNYNY